jgi:hypothetical protein
MNMAGVWSGDTLSDARKLVNWAESKNGVLRYVVERASKDAGDPRIEKLMAKDE